VVSLAADSRRVKVRAEARSVLPFDRLELVHNGSAIAAVEVDGSPATAVLEGEVEISQSGWLAARCWGGQTTLAALSERDTIAAHPSPVSVQVPALPLVPELISIALITERLDRMITWVEQKARFETERTKADLLTTFHAARSRLAQLGA